MITNAAGTVMRDIIFYPYGQTWRNIGNNWDLHFASMWQREFASGLDPTPNRLYHSRLFRWMSPDPAGKAAAKVGNPQSWNRYAYVLNNPLSYTDPLGLFTWAANCNDAANAACRQQREAFRSSLKELTKARDAFEKGSKDYKKLDKVLGAYGEEGKGGPQVAFGKVGGAFAGEFNSRTNTITFDLAKMSSAPGVTSQNFNQFFAAESGHEGEHYVDRNLTLARSQQEYRAYDLSSVAAQGLGLPNYYTNPDKQRGLLWDSQWYPPFRQVEMLTGFLETWKDYYQEKRGPVVFPLDP
jgi:RHS repeat-associated protein